MIFSKMRRSLGLPIIYDFQAHQFPNKALIVKYYWSDISKIAEQEFSVIITPQNINCDNHPWRRTPLWESGSIVGKFQHNIGPKILRIHALKKIRTVALQLCHPSPKAPLCQCQNSQPMISTIEKSENIVSIWFTELCGMEPKRLLFFFFQ